MRNDKPSKRLFRAERREGLFRSNGDGSLREPLLGFLRLDALQKIMNAYLNLMRCLLNLS